MTETNDQQLNNEFTAPAELKEEAAPKPKSYDFKRGDIVTDGKNVFLVFDHKCTDYFFVKMIAHLKEYQIGSIYFDTCTSIDDSDWRKATELEAKLIRSLMDNITGLFKTM